MKSVLISIQPKWCELIASGKKTVEVRKTKPELKTPFKCYIYETLGYKIKLSNICKGAVYIGCGKVIGEFVCDNIISAGRGNYVAIPKRESCLDALDLMDYADGKTVYGWHISNLKIYDEPKELGEFYRECEYEKDCGSCPHLYVENTPNCYETWCEIDGKIPITRPPQSWCYVESGG